MQGDPLSDVLTSVRLSGAIFYYLTFRHTPPPVARNFPGGEP